MAYVVVDVGAMRILLARIYVKDFFIRETIRQRERIRESDVTTVKDEYW